MGMKNGNIQAKKGGNLSQQAIYGKISAISQEVLDTLIALLSDPNRNLRFAAAKTLLNKIVPDLKSVEVGGALDEDGKRQPIQIYFNRGGGFLPATIQLSRTSIESDGSAPEVQSISLAPTSAKDDNSDNGVDSTKST